MGYSIKETKKLLNELLSCCYDSDSSDIEHQFVAEMKCMNSMVDVWKLWERYELDRKYPDVDKYVRKYKDQERMYGKSRNIDAEINDALLRVDVDYYWFHDLHCSQLILRYRPKRHQWHVDWQFLPW